MLHEYRLKKPIHAEQMGLKKCLISTLFRWGMTDLEPGIQFLQLRAFIRCMKVIGTLHPINYCPMCGRPLA